MEKHDGVREPGPRTFSGRVLPVRGRRQAAGEEGYILLAVLFLAVMVLILLSIAAPKVAADIQRDREVEMVHRGQQYVRAIKLYYKKFGTYPPNMDALMKTNEIRFLRKRYTDPITGKDDWRLIHFGENKTPSYGFFGQQMGGIGGSPLAGVGPGGVGQGLAGSSLTPSNFGGSGIGGSAFGNNSSGGGVFGSTPSGNTSAGGSSVGVFPVAGASNGGAGTDPSSGSSGSATAASGTGTATGTGTDANSGSGSNGSPAFGSTGQTTGQTFGGGGVIGVESVSPKATILVWKKKTHFNEWEFWYDPNADRMMISNNAAGIGTPAGAAGNSGAAGTNGINSTGTATPSQFNQSPSPPAPPPPPE